MKPDGGNIRNSGGSVVTETQMKGVMGNAM